MFDRKTAQSFGAYPLRLIWVPIELPMNDYPVLFSMSVPKRKFRKAADRNQLRRRIREAYRLHKHILYEALAESEKQYGFMLLYTAKEALPYEDIEKGIQKMIRRFLKDLGMMN